MAVLVDTSVLGRLADIQHPDRALAQQVVVKLHARGEVLHITPQNLIEFRNFATRPVKPGNGLGLSAVAASQLMTQYETDFQMLDETPAVYPVWRAIVDGLGIIGKTVHDARLVAVCHVHGVTQILTFNVNHFTTLAKFGPVIVVLDPRAI